MNAPGLDIAISHAAKAAHEAYDILSHYDPAEAVSFELRVANLTEKNTAPLLEKLRAIKSGVYWFECANLLAARRAYVAFQEFAATDSGLLKPKDNLQESLCLFVGGATGRGKMFTRRLRAHFGFGTQTNRSLNLSRWEPKGALNCTLNIVEMTGLDPTIIRAVESALWDLKKPMFGKHP